MALKFAFSNVACPDWTLEQLAAKAEEYGYTGVELRTLGVDSPLASDPARSDAKHVRDVLGAHGLELVCLSTSITMHEKSASVGKDVVWRMREAIDAAAEMGANAVRVLGNEVEPGDTRRATLQRIAERIGQLADHAGDQQVRILFENSGSLNFAKDWWWLFELVQHPFVGMAWNAANAAAAGEGPSVAIPVLNSRIKLVKIKDIQIGQGAGFVPLGEGNVEIEHIIKRLLGIGYTDHVCFEWDKAWLPSLAEPDEALPDAIEKLKGWTAAIEESIEKAKVKADKAAAKNAPKKRAELQAK